MDVEGDNSFTNYALRIMHYECNYTGIGKDMV